MAFNSSKLYKSRLTFFSGQQRRERQRISETLRQRRSPAAHKNETGFYELLVDVFWETERSFSFSIVINKAC